MLQVDVRIDSMMNVQRMDLNDYVELRKTKECINAYEAYDMANVCNNSEKYVKDIIEDENNYIVELDAENAKIAEFQNEQEEKINDLYKEIKNLQEKQQKGEITEEEEKNLEDKTEELNSFGKSFESELDSKNNTLADKNNQFLEKYDTDIKVYEKLADVAKRDGKKLSDTKVKGGVFRKIFGNTGKNKKKAGEKLLKAATSLDKTLKEQNISHKTIAEANPVKNTTAESAASAADTQTSNTANSENSNSETDKKRN